MNSLVSRCLSAIFLLLMVPWVSANADAIVGDWVLPDGTAIVRMAKQADGSYSGEVASVIRPEFAVFDGYGTLGEPRTDVNNPKKGLRSRPVVGMALTSGLEYDGEQWQGKIYDPVSGKTYSCTLSLLPSGHIKVRGYVGFSALGRTMYWERLDIYKANVAAMFSTAAQ